MWVGACYVASGGPAGGDHGHYVTWILDCMRSRLARHPEGLLVTGAGSSSTARVPQRGTAWPVAQWQPYCRTACVGHVADTLAACQAWGCGRTCGASRQLRRLRQPQQDAVQLGHIRYCDRIGCGSTSSAGRQRSSGLDPEGSCTGQLEYTAGGHVGRAGESVCLPQRRKDVALCHKPPGQAAAAGAAWPSPCRP